MERQGQEVGVGLAEEQGEEGAVPGSERSSEMWVPLGWIVSFQGVGLE